MSGREGDLLGLQGPEQLLLHLGFQDVATVQGAVVEASPLGAVQGLQVDSDGAV